MSSMKLITAFVLLFSTFLNASEEALDEGIVALSPEQIKEAHIETRQAAPATLRIILPIPAKITTNGHQQAHVVAKASGIVIKINKNLGDGVHADEGLAILESKEMAEAKGAYLTALKREKLAAQTLASEEALKDKKVSSEQDFQHTVLAAREARINLEVAMQQLYILGMNNEDIRRLAEEEMQDLRNYAIKAPLDGVVVAKDISLGSLISADQEVYTIANLDTVWVEMGIYLKDLPYVKLGQKLWVSSIKSDQPIAEAEITQLSPIINEETRTAAAVATLPNNARNWFPGSYVCANVVVDEAKVPVAVLKEAIHEIDGVTCLFIQHPQGFEKREVKIGRSDDKFVEIISGIESGTSYASTQTFLLKAELGKMDAEL
jgi:cobalt-zinc-cadmium efflux system membrane fusion protein